MQIFQPLEPADFALVEGKQPKKEELYSFCGKYETKIKGSCWSEGWPLYREEITTPSGLVKYCSKVENSGQRSRCFNGMFYIVTPLFNFEEKKLTDFCGKLPKNILSQCFANAASRMIEVDWRFSEKAVTLCKDSAKFGGDEACFNELLVYSTYNYHPGSEEFFNLCNSMPPVWREKCTKGYTQ